MALLVISLALGILVIIAVIAAARAPWPGRPVTFKNLDEEQAVYGVATWASKQLGMQPDDIRLRYSLLLWAYSANFNWMGCIPAEELAILGPFIDSIIEGKGPPLNLPAEYEDTRPATLKRFKERMQAEGLWPRQIRAPGEHDGSHSGPTGGG